MELLHAEQVSFDRVYSNEIDLVIAVSGYESRAPYIMERIKLGDETKVVLAFEERVEELCRPQNDRVFQELGFHFIHESGDRCPDIGRIMSLIPPRGREALTVLLDYSCMTKLWYASFVNHFMNHRSEYKKIRVLFAYTMSEYVEPKKPRPLKVVEPIGCNPGGMISGKPLALVMGLGYEKNRAEYLQKALNPEETYCFYADPANDKRFVEKIYINNFRLIDSLHKKNHVFTYPIKDMDKADQLLTSLCLDLRLRYRPVLAPLGPKPFGLLNLLFAARYPDVDVWRVSAGKLESVYDRKPLGEPLVYSVEFGSDHDYMV